MLIPLPPSHPWIVARSPDSVTLDQLTFRRESLLYVIGLPRLVEVVRLLIILR